MTKTPGQDRECSTEQLASQIRDLNERLERLESEKEQLISNELMARATAESAIREKDDFAATLSHEIRTPLNSILGYAQLLRMRGFADTDFANKGVEVIEKNARAQAALISDLLDLSHLSSGTLRLEIGPVNINRVVEEVVVSLTPEAESKEIKFATAGDRIRDDIPVDFARIKQVLSNLVSHAVKCTPQSKIITIELRNQITHVEIAVTDSGYELDSKILSGYFDPPDQKLDENGKSKRFGGIGLNLALARDLTKLHGGTIRAENTGLGYGTTFIVRFPTTRDRV